MAGQCGPDGENLWDSGASYSPEYGCCPVPVGFWLDKINWKNIIGHGCVSDVLTLAALSSTWTELIQSPVVFLLIAF